MLLIFKSLKVQISDKCFANRFSCDHVDYSLSPLLVLRADRTINWYLYRKNVKTPRDLFNSFAFFVNLFSSIMFCTIWLPSAKEYVLLFPALEQMNVFSAVRSYRLLLVTGLWSFPYNIHI